MAVVGTKRILLKLKKTLVREKCKTYEKIAKKNAIIFMVSCRQAFMPADKKP